MSYPASIDDISPFLEKNHVEQSDDVADPKKHHSSRNQRARTKNNNGIIFQENGPIPVQEELLYDTIRKMSSGEENTEEENEEDGVLVYSDDPSLDQSGPQSVPKSDADTQHHIQIPYTSSPHPQRHSRWTSRFLTHPSHWRPSSNTPAIPHPLPDPHQSLEQRGHKKEYGKISISASKVLPSSDETESAKNQYSFKEWESQPVSSWTMDLPPMSSLYNSMKYNSQEKLKKISWPVTEETVTKSNSGAHSDDEDYSPSLYVDTYFMDNKYSNALTSDPQNINVASRDHREMYGDTPYLDAKNIALNSENDEISSNKGMRNLVTGKVTSTLNGAPSFKSTSALSSPWSPSNSAKTKSNSIANNDIWSEDDSPQSGSSYKINVIRSSTPLRSHSVQKSQGYENINNVHQLSDGFTKIHVTETDSKKIAYGDLIERTFDDIDEKSDVHKIKSGGSGYSNYQSIKTDSNEESETGIHHMDKHNGSNNLVIAAKKNHRVPAHSSLQTGAIESSSNDLPGKVLSFPDISSTKNLMKKGKKTIHISSDEVNEYYPSEEHSFGSSIYKNEVNNNVRSDSANLPLSRSSLSFFNSSSMISLHHSNRSESRGDSGKTASADKRTDKRGVSPNVMQNEEAYISEQMHRRTNELGQTTINNSMHKKKDRATKVQNDDPKNDRTTMKKLSVPLQLEDYGGNKKIMNDVKDHPASFHVYDFDGPRTSALKSDTNRNSSKLNKKGDIKNRNRTLISDTHASPDLSTPVFIPPKRRPKQKEVNIPDEYKLRMNWNPTKVLEVKDFYRDYNFRDGAVTAIVLGGFFAFVCLLVIYKTKIKPMWKNRGKRLTTTPATASVAENPMNSSGVHGDGIESLNYGETGKGSTCMVPLDGQVHECDGEEHPCVQDCDDVCENCVVGEDEDEDDAFEGFECIPLQTVNCSEEDEDDIFFLDEFGNYVFPISTPTSIVPGGGTSGNVFVGASSSCSCQPSADELDTDFTRRVSQVGLFSAMALGSD